MANASQAPSRPRRRWWLWVPLALIAVALLAWVAVKQSVYGQRAEVGAGYIAHVVCSCRYVGNRDMASCATDFEPGTEIVQADDDPERRQVTASVTLLSRRTARFDPEYGCALDTP